MRASAARARLQEKGISFQILEASDGIGGRVRTDEADGYLLDRGFQVLLTAYPEAKRVLDYARLELKSFAPGAISWYAGQMNKLIDPWRTHGAWKEALQSDFGTLGDKLRIARLRSRLRNSSIEEIFARPDRSTKEALESAHFSQPMIHRFFRPFLGGILLDGALKSSSRMYEFVFKMMSEGDAAVPSRGMGAIPAQLAEKLPADAVQLNTRVEELHENELKLAGGEVHAGACDCGCRRWPVRGAAHRGSGAGIAKRDLLLLCGGGTAGGGAVAVPEWRRSGTGE